jgi:RNA polymerase subunit RPABC4/transcription elongation factor Spt4
MVCPKCGSNKIARKYAAFWAQVDADGDDIAQNFGDHESNTELTDDALCLKCEHEFEYE